MRTNADGVDPHHNFIPDHSFTIRSSDAPVALRLHERQLRLPSFRDALWQFRLAPLDALPSDPRFEGLLAVRRPPARDGRDAEAAAPRGVRGHALVHRLWGSTAGQPDGRALCFCLGAVTTGAGV